MTMATHRGARRSSPQANDDAPGSSGGIHPAQRLRVSFAAVRLSISWLGVRKSLTTDQRAQAADTFGAEGQYLSAAKKLLDTRDPSYKVVTAIRGQAISLWRGISLPYPDPGVRLIRQTDASFLNDRMTTLRSNLSDAVEQLNKAYGNLRQAARKRLGRLYNEDDYPASLRGLFAIDWDFPSVEPPEYLRRLNPELYEQEKARMTARFDEAVRLAEQAFTEELAKLVTHITERLSGEGSVPGEAKVFRDSAVTNLRDFFERFRGLSVGSNQELEDLVATAQKAVSGVEPQALRDSQALRQQVSTQLSAVAASLDQLMVDRPRRKILRTHQAEGSI